MEKQIKTSTIKPNPNNPRVIRDDKFKKLVNSIKEFPQMMALRPMVVDESSVLLGGNMRLRAIQELGMKEIPDAWLKKAADLTEEQKKEFVVKDNVGFGEWDFDVLANEWDAVQLEDWGLPIPVTLDEIQEMQPEEIDKKLDDYNDENCKLPIVPQFHEKHTYFIILTDNEIDEAFIRSKFDLEKKHTSHKSTDDRISNVIPFAKVQELCLK